MTITRHLDKFFLLIGLIAVPNLYFIAEYNVSLMIFCFFLWNMPYKSITLYLLIISWVIDGVRILTKIGKEG